jgi:hypothetical protein
MCVLSIISMMMMMIIMIIIIIDRLDVIIKTRNVKFAYY